MGLLKKILSVLVSSAFLLSPLWSQERGVVKKVEMEDELGGKFVAYENSWALIIGINEYAESSLPRLSYAVDDANAIAKLLAGLEFPEENIKVLTDQEATLSRIKEQFVALGQKTKHNDRLIVYWAGHGTTQNLPRGGEMGYLVPFDGKLDALYSTCLSMDDIKRLSELVAAKHVLFLVDACYGGLAAYSSRGPNEATNHYLKQLTSAEAVQIITAGTKGEQVVESSNWGHSAFAKALLDGFETKLVDRDNNGVVTADELYSYLAPKVFELSRSEGGHAHRPVFANLKASEGQFTFLVSVPEYKMTIAGLPANNRVFIGGKEVAANKDTVVQSLNRGTYLVEVEAPGYERYSTTIDLSSERALQPHMLTWTEAARRRLLDLENAIRKTRVLISGGLSFPVSDFGHFVGQSPGHSIIAQYEHDVGSGVTAIGGIEYTKWQSHKTAYGDYHPDYTPEFNLDDRASATIIMAGVRAYWDLKTLRVFGMGEIGLHFMNYGIQDLDNAVDLRKSESNLSFALGIGCSLGLTKKVNLDFTARQTTGQLLKLTYAINPYDPFVYGANDTRLSYVEIAFGFSYLLTSLFGNE